MKVGTTDPVVPPAERASAPIPKPVVAETQDRNTSAVTEAIGMARQNVEATRLTRVQDLAAAVSSGSYQPNAQQIASAILDDAMIDAELEAK